MKYRKKIRIITSSIDNERHKIEEMENKSTQRRRAWNVYALLFITSNRNGLNNIFGATHNTTDTVSLKQFTIIFFFFGFYESKARFFSH